MSAEYIAGAEDPSLSVTWTAHDGTLIDFSTGWTFVLKLYKTGVTPLITKTTGITGAATDPNVVIVWATNQLDIAPGAYRLEIKATKAGRDRYLRSQLVVLPRST
jgi:hypothetical protein